MKKFSDFATEEKPLEGDKVRIDEVLNKELIICAYKIGSSKYQEKDKARRCVTLQIKYSEREDPKVIFTGSEVIAEQCEKYKGNMPFETIIKKVNKYYTFS